MFQKKSLGQNFLKNKSIIQKITDAGLVSKNDTVLEIGPGKGALTESLLDTGAKVVAIEKDDRLMNFLDDKFHTFIKSGQLTVINGDIEKIEIESLPCSKQPYKLVANIPYYITGLIIRKFLESDRQPNTMVLLVQKEVAERIARGEKESILSLSVKAYGDPQFVGVVKAGNFDPKPKVDSAILRIEHISKHFFDSYGIEEKDFFEVLNKGFAAKRKKLLNNLSVFKEKEELKDILGRIGLEENTRAENVSLSKWAEITQAIT